MERHNTGRFVTTAMMTAVLTVGGAGLAMAQVRQRPAWRWQADRATHALNMLEAQGFTRFSDFQAAGRNFTADVQKNGQTMQVMIDPDTDRIETGGQTSA